MNSTNREFMDVRIRLGRRPEQSIIKYEQSLSVVSECDSYSGSRIRIGRTVQAESGNIITCAPAFLSHIFPTVN
jgi:hypothetical protein